MEKNFNYCAFCRGKRKSFPRTGIRITTLLLASVLTLFVSYGLWGLIDERSAVLGFLLWLLGEAYTLSRWRASVICSDCGFDPVLYKKDLFQAIDRVKATLDKKRKQPFLVPESNPFRRLPLKKAPPEQKGLSDISAQP